MKGNNKRSAEPIHNHERNSIGWKRILGSYLFKREMKIQFNNNVIKYTDSTASITFLQMYNCLEFSGGAPLVHYSNDQS